MSARDSRACRISYFATALISFIGRGKRCARSQACGQPALSRVELGGGVPDIETLRRLGNAMDVRFHVIVGNEDAEQEENLLVS